MRDSRCSFKINCFSNIFLYVPRQYLRVYCTSSNFKNLQGNSFKKQLLKKPKPTIFFEMFYSCVIKVFVFQYRLQRPLKHNACNISKTKNVGNQTSQARLFTTLDYNMLKSKMTEKSYCLLELRFNIGQKIQQTSRKVYAVPSIFINL